MFLINNEVVFDPQLHTLRSIKDPRCVTLFSTSSSCLKELIHNHGTIVAKVEVIDKVWEGKACSISDNTFYQMIMNLRRFLKQVGLKDEIIKTIPRKGLLIPLSVQISEYRFKDNDLSHANSYSTNDSGLNQVATKEEDVLGRLLNIIRYKGLIGLSSSSSMFSPLLLIISLLLLIMFFFNINSLYENSDEEDHFILSDYFYVGDVSKCVILSDNQALLKKEFLEVDHFDCNNRKFIYITSSEQLTRKSMIICDTAQEKNINSHCKSIYYIL